MPQKPVFSRSPVLTVPYCFPAAGTVRTTDERIARLYQNANRYAEQPCLLEGLFRLACLIRNKPLEEPVAERILRMTDPTENGSFPGSFSDQICMARAVFALFEYNSDRNILKRIAEWIRYVEIEFETLIVQDGILYNPADLMELLVKYYLVSGVRSTLRLCARLRAEAFDWSTSLHTYQQSVPFRRDPGTVPYSLPVVRPDQIDYEEKKKLINHALLMADGVRYTLFAGLFSGNRQELTAGRTVWLQLRRYHRALCGGTTGSPFLSGNAPDLPVSNLVLAAWTEAFGAQMILADSFWAADEMIRIVYNGLDECLNRTDIPEEQRINHIPDGFGITSGGPELYARITRAAAVSLRNAVSLTENGFRINYPLPAKYLLMIRKQPFILKTDFDAITFQCKTPVYVRAEVYLSPYNTCSVCTERKGKKNRELIRNERPENGYCVVAESEWLDQDRIIFLPDSCVLSEETHHQGIAFIAAGRLLSMPADNRNYAMAICGSPACTDGKVTVSTAPADRWTLREGQPSDIPVLPVTSGEPAPTVLKPYSECPCRITVFPKARRQG